MYIKADNGAEMTRLRTTTHHRSPMAVVPLKRCSPEIIAMIAHYLDNKSLNSFRRTCQLARNGSQSTLMKRRFAVVGSPATFGRFAGFLEQCDVKLQSLVRTVAYLSMNSTDTITHQEHLGYLLERCPKLFSLELAADPTPFVPLDQHSISSFLSVLAKQKGDLDLQHLTICQNRLPQVPIYKIPDHLPTQNQLRRIRRLDFQYIADLYDIPFKADQESPGSFIKLFDGVENLTFVVIYGEQTIDGINLEDVLMAKEGFLPALKHLTLCGVKASKDGLTDWLGLHSSTLETLHLGDVGLDSESISFVDWLGTGIKQRTLRLQNFALLSHGDSWYWLFQREGMENEEWLVPAEYRCCLEVLAQWMWTEAPRSEWFKFLAETMSIYHEQPYPGHGSGPYPFLEIQFSDKGFDIKSFRGDIYQGEHLWYEAVLPLGRSDGDGSDSGTGFEDGWVGNGSDDGTGSGYRSNESNDGSNESNNRS